jgi:hypothetical protein
VKKDKEKVWVRLCLPAAIGCFAGLGFWSYYQPPLHWWSVLVFFLLFFLAVFLFFLATTKNKKLSVFLAVFLAVVLVLRFFKLANVLNLVLFALFLVAFWFSFPGKS